MAYIKQNQLNKAFQNKSMSKINTKI